MRRVLITFKPMGSYFLGGEKIFAFDNGQNVRSPYFIRSLREPSQSTLLGMLRYVLLEQVGLLKAHFTYTEEETAKIHMLIGASSFSIGGVERFGKIHGVGPLFMQDGDQRAYIRVPANHQKGKTTYSPMPVLNKMDRKRILASFPDVPVAPAFFNAKEGLEDGYLCLETGKVVSSSAVFSDEEVRVGIRKRTRDGDTLDDGFFKRVYYNLNGDGGWCFAFHALLEDEAIPRERFLMHMGQKQSLFHAECMDLGVVDESAAPCPRAGDPLEEAVRQKVQAEKGMFLALSDCYAARPLSDFCTNAIAATRSFRSLATNYRPTDGRYYSKLTKSSEVFSVYRAGSIFCQKDGANDLVAEFSKEKACKAVGMNCLVSIGG